MTPEQLAELLDEEREESHRRGRLDLSIADYLDDDDEQLRGGLL